MAGEIVLTRGMIAQPLRLLAITLRSQAGLLTAQADSLDEMAGRIERGEEVGAPLSLRVAGETMSWEDFTAKITHADDSVDAMAEVLAAMIGRQNGGQVNDTVGLAADVDATPERLVKRLQAMADAGLVIRVADSQEWYPTGQGRQALERWRERHG